MDPDFWHQRWRENRIGFHQDAPTPLLVAHWAALKVPADARVFVPLAGKSQDMAWLAAQGHEVLGVELSSLAIEQFFAEHEMTPDVRDSNYGRRYSAGPIELVCGDVFNLPAAVLSGCGAAFDRAALIALPAPMRERYVREIQTRMPPGCRGLLITLEYPQAQMQGPPFSVPEQEVRDLCAADWTIEVLQRRDILANQPRFREDGVTALETVAYKLERRDR